MLPADTHDGCGTQCACGVSFEISSNNIFRDESRGKGSSVPQDYKILNDKLLEQ